MSSLVPLELNLFGGNGDTDTFITNATGSVSAFDPLKGGFVTLPDGEDGELLLRHREYLKCGYSGEAEYRPVLLFNPTERIRKEAIESNYGIDRAFLTLTVSEGTAEGAYEAFMLPAASVDASVSWYKPSEGSVSTWTTAGGDSVAPLSGVLPSASVADGKLRFDVSEMLTQWSISGSDTLAVGIKSTSSAQEVLKFHAWESQEGLLGGGNLQNCRFLAAGDANSMRTEGVFVQVEVVDGNFLMTGADSRPDAANQFRSFQKSVGVGATFALFDPDTNNDITFGTTVCTVLDRPTENSVLLSGLTLPDGVTTHTTTVEFLAETVIPYGSYILEFASPSDSLKSQVMSLTEGAKLGIRYFSTAANNNSKDFTVASVSDETRYKSRVRIYLNEGVISENRNGLDTEIRLSETKPQLTLHLSLY